MWRRILYSCVVALMLRRLKDVWHFDHTTPLELFQSFFSFYALSVFLFLLRSFCVSFPSTLFLCFFSFCGITLQLPFFFLVHSQCMYVHITLLQYGLPQSHRIAFLTLTTIALPKQLCSRYNCASTTTALPLQVHSKNAIALPSPIC